MCETWANLFHSESFPELLLVDLSVVPSNHSKLLLKPCQPLCISVQPVRTGVGEGLDSVGEGLDGAALTLSASLMNP